MNRAIFAFLTLCACGHTALEPLEAPSSATLGPAESPEPQSTTPEDALGESGADADIRAVLSGELVSDGVASRLRAQAEAAVERLLAHHTLRDANATLYFPPGSRPDHVLALLYEAATPAVRVAAQRLWRSAMTLQSQRASASPEQRRVASNLNILAAGIDLPEGPSWTGVEPVEVCVAELPTLGALVRVTRDCTCGEVHACAARLDGDRVELSVHIDPDSPAICHDCYPSTAACRLPALSAGRTYALRSGGRTFGNVRSDERSRAIATCAP